MRRILAGVLFLAACVGDRPEVTPPASGGGEDTGGTPGATRLAPEDCGTQSWHVATTAALDLAAIDAANGFQVLSVPLTGGAVSVFGFDRNAPITKPSLQIDAGMTGIAASRIGDYVIATSTNANSIDLNLLTPQQTAVPLAQVAPGLVAKSAFQVADWNTILPVADAQGLRIETFDPMWNATTIRVATTEPALAMTAAPMQYATVAAWATASSCNLMTMYKAETGPMVTVPGACLAPALAIDPTTELGVLAYEGDDGVRMLGWEHQNVVGVSQLIAVGGSSPHAVFDGSRVWISLLDADHHLVVGYVDAGRFISTTFTTDPHGDAYDLVLHDGQVLTVSNANDAFVVQHFCLAPTNG